MNALATMSKQPFAAHVASREPAEDFPVFPIRPGCKTPLPGSKGFKDATNDPAQLAEWACDYPDANVGHCPNDSGHFVLDVDGREGEESLAALEAEHGKLPATFTVKTPSCGRHIWFKGAAPSSARKIGAGLDIRGVGGYVLVPGSIVGGREYTVESGDDASDAPEWLTALIGKSVEVEPRATEKLPGIDPDSAESRARRYLQHEAPLAIEGQGGDQTTYKVANAVKDRGVDEAIAHDLMLELWNDRCTPPWTREDLQKKVANAYRYGREPQGASAPETQFDAVEEPKPLETAAPISNPSKYPAPIDASELAVTKYPRAAFSWEKFVLHKNVNLLYGDGGTGKTLLTLHIAVATAAGIDLFGFATKQMPVLIILAEDDNGETKARLGAIAEELKVDLHALPIKLWCLPGHDLNIARITDDGRVSDGPFKAPLEAVLKNMDECLLILDTVADFAQLDETKRPPVNALCKVVLQGLCLRFGTTVLVNAHPSKASMADGSGYAGSTAWNNAVRNRLTLERGEGGNSRRVLKVAKANYGPESELDLYQFGPVFMTQADASETEAEERDAVLAEVLAMIDKGMTVVRNNGNGQKPKDVAAALLENRKIKINKNRVLEFLNYWERNGKLKYVGADKNNRTKAGFQRSEACAK